MFVAGLTYRYTAVSAWASFAWRIVCARLPTIAPLTTSDHPRQTTVVLRERIAIAPPAYQQHACCGSVRGLAYYGVHGKATTTEHVICYVAVGLERAQSAVEVGRLPNPPIWRITQKDIYSKSMLVHG